MEGNYEQKIMALNTTPVHVPPISIEKKVYTISEIQDILGISMTTAYQLTKRNLFNSVKVGAIFASQSEASMHGWMVKLRGCHNC